MTKRILTLVAAFSLCCAAAAFAGDKNAKMSSASNGSCSKQMASSCSQAKSAEMASNPACTKEMAAGCTKDASASCPHGSNAKMALASNQMRFSVSGMCCEGSAAKIKDCIQGVDGVASVQCDMKSKTAVVSFKGDKNAEAVSKKLSEAGFKAKIVVADATSKAASKNS